MPEGKFMRTLRQIEKEAIQAPSAKANATPLSEEVRKCVRLGTSFCVGEVCVRRELQSFRAQAETLSRPGDTL